MTEMPALTRVPAPQTDVVQVHTLRRGKVTGDAGWQDGVRVVRVDWDGAAFEAIVPLSYLRLANDE